MALLRGANRPLLTKLIRQETAMETKELPRLSDFIVDFQSNRVIQVRQMTKFHGKFVFCYTFPSMIYMVIIFII